MGATGLPGGKPVGPSGPSPPVRISRCSSIRKRVPLYAWKNVGRPPGDGFPRAAASSFRANTWGRAGPGQAPPKQASLRAMCPTLEKSGQVHRVPGPVSELREALTATQRTARFPVDHTCQPVSHPAEAECQGRARDMGPGRGAGHGSRPGGAVPGGRDPRPGTGSPWGSRA